MWAEQNLATTWKSCIKIILSDNLHSMINPLHSESVPDGRAAKIARGVIRFLVERGNACLSEFTFKTSRRADIIALDHKGVIRVVEVKSSQTDFYTDEKWQEYKEFCDLFYFAVAPGFPTRILPTNCGLMIADAYSASIIREAKANTLNAARRRHLTLRFAQASAGRLLRFTDQNWVRY